ncbi:MAG TPA: hypothetical protein VGN00_14350 [Puia sp.]|jgi:hypothetical protein
MKKVKIVHVALVAGALFSFQSPMGDSVQADQVTQRTVESYADSVHNTDSVIKVAVQTTAETIAPADTTVGPFKLPTWLLTLLTAISAGATFAQWLLKRIPTDVSIKIPGWVGVVLDALTFWQPDKSTAVRPTAPPPVQNGVEKPALKDLQNH